DDVGRVASRRLVVAVEDVLLAALKYLIAETTDVVRERLVARIAGRREHNPVDASGPREPREQQLDHRDAVDRADDLVRKPRRPHARLNDGHRSTRLGSRVAHDTTRHR